MNIYKKPFEFNCVLVNFEFLGSISLFLYLIGQKIFSHFPYGTASLSVRQNDLGLEDGTPMFIFQLLVL